MDEETANHERLTMRAIEGRDMLKGHRVGVIIPCYQVAGTVAGVIEGIPDHVDVIIAVDDASTDGTARVLEDLGSARLQVIRHESNLGVGGAMASGFERALDAELDIVVKIDGDGQMDPAWMRDLVDPLIEDAADYAKGNRFLHRKELVRMPLLRKVGNILLTFLTKVASGYWYTFDPQNGFLAIRADFLRSIDLEKLRSRRYFFENEMLIQLNVVTARVLDCPMPSMYDGESSSLRIRTVLAYFPLLLVRGFFARIFGRYVLRDFSAVVPLYFLGAILFVWGVGFGAVTWYRYGTAHVPAPTGTIMVSVLPLILGFQMLLQGLLLEILYTPKPLRQSRMAGKRGKPDADE